METMRSVWICLMLVAAAGIGKGNGQAEDCTSQLAPVAPCLDYVQGSAASPSKDCCSGLSSLLTTSPVCLCQLSEGRLNFSSLGITVDMKRALSLPTACKIKGADRNRCAAILGSPAQAPHAAAAGPGPAMASGSETGTSAGAGGSAAAPNAARTAAASPLAVLVSALVVVAGAVITL